MYVCVCMCVCVCVCVYVCVCEDVVILRMDIEGAEYEVARYLLTSGVCVCVCSVCVYVVRGRPIYETSSPQVCVCVCVVCVCM